MTRKLTKQAHGSHIVSSRGFFCGAELTKELMVAVSHYLRLPFSCLAASIQGYTLKPTRVCGISSSIVGICDLGRLAKVGTAIVQAISVNVVRIAHAAYQCVHIDSSRRLEAIIFSRRIPNIARFHGVPRPFGQPCKISLVHDRKEVARKGNMSYRWVRWLGDLVSFDTLFLHKSSTKGFVLPSHLTTYLLCILSGIIGLAIPINAQTQIFGSSTVSPPALIQSCNAVNASPATTLTCTFGSNITAGDSIKIAFGGNGSNGCGSLSFSGSDTFVQDSHSPVTSSLGDKLWLYSVSSSVGGYGAITVTTTSCDAGVQAYEVSNSATEDLSASATGNNTAPSGGSLTTSNANDFLATCYVGINTSGTVTTPTGYTADIASTNANLWCAHRIVTATGTYTDNWVTANSIHWDAIHAAYK